MPLPTTRPCPPPAVARSPPALTALTTWSFHQAGPQRIWLHHCTANPASRRVAQRASLSAEGTDRGAVRHADGWHDTHPATHRHRPAPPGDTVDATMSR
jgi:hypothetical protein